MLYPPELRAHSFPILASGILKAESTPSVMQPVQGKGIVVAILAVIGITVSIAAYVLFFK